MTNRGTARRPGAVPFAFAPGAFMSLFTVYYDDLAYETKGHGPHKYGCLMAVLPQPLADSIRAWTLRNTPDVHLGPGGRETEIHITVKYGFKDSSPDAMQHLRDVLRRFGPFTVQLGQPSLFTAGYGKWVNDDGDVLKLDVEGVRLHELNKIITAEFSCKDSHPDYVPHVTLAYLDPAHSSLYDGLVSPFAGKSVAFTNLVYSNPAGQREGFPLSWLGEKRLELYGVKSYFAGCPRDEGGHCLPQDQTGAPKKRILPRKPKFESSDPVRVAANQKAVAELTRLAELEKWDELDAHPGTPSDKVQLYKELLQDVGKQDAVVAALPDPASVPLTEPTADDADDWIMELRQHPYFAAVRRFIQGSTVQTSELYSVVGKWDQDRVNEVHQPIIDKFLNPNAAVPIGQKPKLVMVIGPPGAGKSSIGMEAAKELADDYTLANPDDVRAELPEHNGWNAPNTHNEACWIAKQIRYAAQKQRHNLLYDSTGQMADRMLQMAQEFNDKGYDVHVVHVGVPPHVAAYRTAKRFMDNPFGKVDPNSPPSRFVPPNYVYHEVGAKPDRTYEELKKSKFVTGGVSFDNSGTQPEQVDEF